MPAMVDAKSETHFHTILTSVVAVLVQLIALIPPDRPDERRTACAFVLQEVANGLECMIREDEDANDTRH